MNSLCYTDEINSEIGRTLRKFRKEAHLTQEQAAEEMGVEVKAIYRWEKGLVKIHTIKLLQLLEIYNKTPDDFIENLESENTKSYFEMDMKFEKGSNEKEVEKENDSVEKHAGKKFNPEGIMFMIILCVLTFAVFMTNIFFGDKIFVCTLAGILIIICAIYSLLLRIENKINQA